MEIAERIRQFWNQQPCGTTHVNLPAGTREYFIEFDRYFEALYPYLLPFLELERLRGKTVLEIGLGSGFTLHRIAGMTRECYGLDVSEKTLELNERRGRILGLDFKLIHASATDIPLKSDSVDAVVSIGCLHHIPQIGKAVSEIHRVLKPDGVFKGMVYNLDSWRLMVFMPLLRGTMRRWTGKSRQQCINEFYDGINNPYGSVFSRGDVSTLFRGFHKLRFEIRNFSGEEVLPKIGGLVPRDFWLATLGRLVGLDLYFTGAAVK
jgi:ubiquinone/menaquinone biosynthesis C-methylase UbiE